ncbi:MAG: hypothetical protein QM687_03795 [Ferruginibacter sp.]
MLLLKNPTLVVIALLFFNCNRKEDKIVAPPSNTSGIISKPSFDSSIKTIHVLVALCDNKYQGIVPVPPKIGNGQDPANNLYWGCAFGVKSYFKQSKSWQLIRQYRIDSIKMERLIFKHTKNNYYLVADAYNGKNIRECTVDFFNSCAGRLADTVTVNRNSIGTYGNATLLAYIGHDGLMDFSLTQSFAGMDNKKRDAIMLACYSKRFFQQHLAATKANPLLWSTGLMSPEAYTLHDALEKYMTGDSPESIRSAAAKAYARYQKCSEKAARNLLVTGY